MHVDGRPCAAVGGGGLRRRAGEGTGFFEVIELRSREPSLEELFLSLYGSIPESRHVTDLVLPRAACRTASAERSPVFGQTAKRAVRSGLLLGARLRDLVVASSGRQLHEDLHDQPERDALAEAFGSNHATAALFGPAPDLQTVAGFVVFKSFMTIMILGALWGLLTSTRLLRGEEDAGRWDLLLCGRVHSSRGHGAGAGGPGRRRSSGCGW